ncbi:peptidoglycan-binding protein [Bacterioplanes sanyensis]|uniref:Peptidoglycan-binding protein n=1 Tax=Bacterioplanes sanyensis TaxID=1249553 RepID=A0A222FHV4_9GAMM|nr:LysM domain-containing protein [Bacterioplanes sanyensis]ASP37991.1 peptidoglycan-binding protein [Bacterioplanes sanyensis]
MSKTIKRVLLTGLMCLSASMASALPLKADAPQRYTVKEGDTLWHISERFTNDPWQWPEIWYLNRQIEDPHLIFPGDELALIEVNGERRVTVVKRGQSARTVKLSPSSEPGTMRLHPTVRVEPIEAAIPAIPMDAVRGFLRNHRVVQPKELDNAPRVLAGSEGRILMGAGSTVYARGKALEKVASAYSIYRRGQVYRDPETEEVLGLEALDIGQGRVTDVNGDILTMELERTNQHVSAGDLLLQTEDRRILSRFIPKSPKGDVEGQILAVSGGVSQVGQFDVVVLNRGEREGLEPGSVLLVKKAGEVVYDRAEDEYVRLPAERAGMMMVFRTYDKMSYGLIMRATKPLRVGDRFSAP